MISTAWAVRSVVDTSAIRYRRVWWVLVAAFAEPLVWLVGLGVGLGSLIDGVRFDGAAVEYGSFIAPGLIAVSAMNGSVFDATYNFHFKLTFVKTYDAMVATPLTITNIVAGEIMWSMLRAMIYAAGFVLIAAFAGLIASWWAILIVPAALLIGLSVAALGILSTTYMRSWHDFDYLAVVLQVLFLCSATFFPLDVYPGWARIIVQATPLYHGVALCRDLAFGTIGVSAIGHVAYLAILAVASVYFARPRLERRLLH